MKIYIVITMILFFNSCDLSSTNDGKVYLQIHNNTGKDISKLIVNDVDYGFIKNDKKSDLKVHKEKLYSYAYINALIDGNEYLYQPDDYLGAFELKNGFHLYVLEIKNGSIHLSFKY
jgi:hypothetical protein